MDSVLAIYLSLPHGYMHNVLFKLGACDHLGNGTQCPLLARPCISPLDAFPLPPLLRHPAGFPQNLYHAVHTTT